MRTRVPVAVLAAVLASAVAVSALPPGRGDEAVLRDGRRRSGVLSFTEGHLRFEPGDGGGPVAPAEVYVYRFSIRPGSPFSAPMLTRLHLADEQRVTGELLGLDGERLRFRTPWAEELTIPRGAAVALTQMPGEVAVFARPFDAGLGGWQAAGGPAVGSPKGPSGHPSLMLDRPGQSATHNLKPPLDAGSFAVSFRETVPAAGARWRAEADFGRAEKPLPLAVTVAGQEGRYIASVPGGGTAPASLAASPGWHRLRVEFSPTALVVTVDDLVLHHDRRKGPGGPLLRVRLACGAATGGEAVRGGVAFTDFGLARAVEALHRPPGDADQDEVWLLSGDQVFGRVTRADGSRINITGRFGDCALTWSEVGGLFFRRAASAPHTAEGERVRVRWRPGPGPVRDELEGVVTGLDDRQLTLAQPVLGSCRIERARLVEVRIEAPR